MAIDTPDCMLNTLQIGMSWFPDRAGGLNRYYYDCANHFSSAEMEFDGLVTGQGSINTNSSNEIAAFASAEASIVKRWQGVRKNFKQLTARRDYDLVVSHFAFYTFPLLDLLGDRPLVTHFHGPWALESGVETNKSLAIQVKKWLERSVYRRSQQFIVLSKTFRDILHQEYGVPLEKIHVVPGGVDIDRFNIELSQAEARSKLGWHSKRPTIFCIRRLAKRMGLENLLTAIVEVSKSYPDIMLYLAGKGELANTLQTQIAELGLEHNVELLGYVADADLPLYYRAADFSVVPTVALEGFGLIVVESLAAGTPVLGTPVGGIPEILRPFDEGLVFAGCEPQQLAKGITEVLSGDRVLPTNDACLQYVRDNYTWQKIASEIKSIYQNALD